MNVFDEECDSCGDIILLEHAARYESHAHTFALPTEDRGVYEAEEYVLCTECIRKIVDFIDDADESETAVEALALETAARRIESTAGELHDTAERLNRISLGDEHS